MAPVQSTEPRLAEQFGGGRLLLSDMRLAFLLLKDARNRTAARLFAVPPEQANLVMLITATMLAETAHRKVKRLLRAPSVPSTGDGLLAAASCRELLWGVTGSHSRDIPFSGALLATALLGGAVGPATFRSLRGIRTSTHRMTVGFHDRYGYIVDPGHWRQQHAQRRRGEPMAPYK